MKNDMTFSESAVSQMIFGMFVALRTKAILVRKSHANNHNKGGKENG